MCMCFQFQGLVIAAFSDLLRPPEKLSEKQSGALMATGVIWSRYSLVIKPKNWNLFSVNMFVAISNGIQLFRIYKCVRSPIASCEHLLYNILTASVIVGVSLVCNVLIASVIVGVSLVQCTYCLCHCGSVSCAMYLLPLSLWECLLCNVLIASVIVGVSLSLPVHIHTSVIVNISLTS